MVIVVEVMLMWRFSHWSTFSATWPSSWHTIFCQSLEAELVPWNFGDLPINPYQNIKTYQNQIKCWSFWSLSNYIQFSWQFRAAGAARCIGFNWFVAWGTRGTLQPLTPATPPSGYTPPDNIRVHQLRWHLTEVGWNTKFSSKLGIWTWT